MKKDVIQRDNHESIQFVRLTTTTFNDKRLTDTACRLLVAMLNNSDDWEINVTYYGNKFGWSPSKTASAKKNLVECGYLVEHSVMTSKGKVYHYSIYETPINKEEEQNQISNVRKPKLGNRSQETDVRKLDTNNTNREKIKADKSKLDKNKEIKISDSVSVNSIHSESNKKVEDKDTNTALQVEEEFFFNYGERPTEDKIIAYVEKRGYSREVGREIFLELHTKDFKNQKGTPIKGIEKYIDSMLQDKSKHSHNTSIESFLQAVTPVNEFIINKYIEMNKEHSIYFQTYRLSAKEAAKEFWTSISKDAKDYNKYVMDFLKSNGLKSMDSFKAYVFRHQERQIQDTGTTYI